MGDAFLLHFALGNEMKKWMFGIPENVHQLADKRQKAREAGDYTESDRLREVIAAGGFAIRDYKSGYGLRPLPDPPEGDDGKA